MKITESGAAVSLPTNTIGNRLIDRYLGDQLKEFTMPEAETPATHAQRQPLQLYSKLGIIMNSMHNRVVTERTTRESLDKSIAPDHQMLARNYNPVNNTTIFSYGLFTGAVHILVESQNMSVEEAIGITLGMCSDNQFPLDMGVFELVPHDWKACIQAAYDRFELLIKSQGK